MLLFELARAVQEAVDVNKLTSASSWNQIKDAHPQFANDIKRYLNAGNFTEAISFINEVFTANHSGKTSNLHPKLSKSEWMGLLEIVKYIKDNGNINRPVERKTDSRYNTDTMSTSDKIRECVDLYDNIVDLLQE